MRGAGLSGAGYVLAQVLNLAAYVVLARLLDPSEFGTFAAATALLGFTLLLTESGLTSALVQRRTGFEEAANSALIASIGGGILFGLLALATAPLLGLFFDSSEVTAIAAVMSGMVPLRILHRGARRDPAAALLLPATTDHRAGLRRRLRDGRDRRAPRTTWAPGRS